ncbi:uncharacterized protein CC84DRAFT_619870 [Paraphaeosphaeria sporulosa]|uniref:Uncharacterized protein n=1 Tax=Paraphaeosphaeria sporulosa TaxID=1460663 RepID=A0A177CIW6_9PLEO|nr:uncharacterized protein CC84DRAFT_619870 [Paraphaeosphaeria sporulosa]OAG06727.1 hypothetical protein CC84DRAFT_619870 [Paraphaeosphaeria sporulosa]
MDRVSSSKAVFAAFDSSQGLGSAEQTLENLQLHSGWRHADLSMMRCKGALGGMRNDQGLDPHLHLLFPHSGCTPEGVSLRQSRWRPLTAALTLQILMVAKPYSKGQECCSTRASMHLRSTTGRGSDSGAGAKLQRQGTEAPKPSDRRGEAYAYRGEGSLLDGPRHACLQLQHTYIGSAPLPLASCYREIL